MRILIHALNSSMCYLIDVLWGLWGKWAHITGVIKLNITTLSNEWQCILAWIHHGIDSADAWPIYYLSDYRITLWPMNHSGDIPACWPCNNTNNFTNYSQNSCSMLDIYGIQMKEQPFVVVHIRIINKCQTVSRHEIISRVLIITS